MWPLKRPVDIISISSDDDESNPFINRPRKIRRRGNPQPTAEEITPQSSEDLQDELYDIQAFFADFISRNIPTQLVRPEVFDHIYTNSNLRLENAKLLNIPLEEISIGDSCLPVWPGFDWDPDAESLHEVLQSHLRDYHVSVEMGNLLRQEIVVKGNRALSEAFELGVQLEDIVIGRNLLPVWGEAAEHLSEHDSSFTVEGSVQYPAADDDMTDICAWTQELITHSEESQLPTPVSDIFSMPSPPPIPFVGIHPLNDGFYDHTDASSDSEVDSDSESEDDQATSSYDDEISLSNFVLSHPVCSESDNIIHDVEIVGTALGFSDVDLEAFWVEDAEELEDLPEAELCIDRDSYEAHFGHEGAVDIEIPDVDVSCTGIIENDIAGLGQSFEPPLSYTEDEDYFSFPEVDDQNDQQHDGNDFSKNCAISDPFSTLTSAFSPPADQDAAYSQDQPGVNIEETDYGFTW